MITFGYVESPDGEAEITQQLDQVDDDYSYKAFVVYQANVYKTIVFVSETRVVLQCDRDPGKFVAFDGPANEMAQIVERANYKLQKASA